MVRKPQNLGALGKLQGPGKQVSARATDTFFQPTGEIEQPTILNLAPLSATLTDFLAKKNAELGRKGALAGKQAAQDQAAEIGQLETKADGMKDPEARREFLKKEFARLQKEGEIKAAADPFFQIGFARSSARARVGAMQNALKERLQEAIESGDPDTILQEEWAEIAEDPSVTNTYGQEVALQARAQVEEQFRAQAGAGRAEKIEREHRANLQQEIGAQFDAILATKSTVSSLDLTGITEFITTEMKGHNVQNIRGEVMGALRLSFDRAADIDPDEAVRAVRAAQDLVVGNARLGDDRSGIGSELLKLEARFEDMSDQEVRKANDEKGQRRRAAVLQAEETYRPAMLEALRDGASLRGVQSAQLDAFAASGEFNKDEMAEVELAMDGFMRSLDKKTATDPEIIESFIATIQGGDIDAAEELVRSAEASGQLEPSVASGMYDQIAQRRDVSDAMEGNPTYVDARDNLMRLRPQGFAAGIQDDIDSEIEDMQALMDQDFQEFVSGLREEGVTDESNQIRKWIADRRKVDKATIRDRQREIREAREGVDAAVRSKSTRMADATADIEAALGSGAITEAEAAEYAQANTAAVNRRQAMFNSPQYLDLKNEVFQQINRQFEEGTIESEAGRLGALRAAQETLKASYNATIDTAIGDPSVTPQQLQATIDRRFGAESDAVMQQLFGKDRAKIGEKVEEGEEVEEAVATVEALNRNRQLAFGLESVVTAPGGRQALTIESVGAAPVAGVPAEFYEKSLRWMRGSEGFFAAKTTRNEIEQSAWTSARALQKDNPAQLRKATESMIEVVGITPAEVLKDTRSFQATLQHERTARTEAALEGQIQHVLRGPSQERAKERLAALRDRKPVDVDLDGYEYKPYTTPFFPNREAMSIFADTAKWKPFLKRIGVDPTDAEEVEAFIDAQDSIFLRTR